MTDKPLYQEFVFAGDMTIHRRDITAVHLLEGDFNDVSGSFNLPRVVIHCGTGPVVLYDEQATDALAALHAAGIYSDEQYEKVRARFKSIVDDIDYVDRLLNRSTTED